MQFSIVPYDKSHNKKEFDCNVQELNNYLRERASQDIRRYYATMFVAVEEETNKVIGYYTLSNASIDLNNVPDEMKKRLPKYPTVPAIRLGRLAVDKSMQGKGLGGELLADAVIRSVLNVSAWVLMIVDAKDEVAVAFYKKYGFEQLIDNDKHLFVMRKHLENFILKNR
ncbi:GNAT family N-acetyltransferase [Synergistaceae bacterium OttesenSCG-928-I11]|nr:GNAT family N-acetyltransferase [Synergistaceae bacterium OttesenSCG-928-I11]